MNKLFGFVSLLALCGGSAVAQPAAVGLEEIVVTATKTGETKLQDTPIAITAFTAAAMDRSGVSDVKDLAAGTPNLLIAENTGMSQVYIRGVGSNNIFSGSDPSSTIHLDGVYLARPASYFNNFLDVERVEVLRGPQGTLYGRNSVGGTINIISRKPDNTLRAKAQFTAGNYEQLSAEGFVSGPLVADRLAASLSFQRSKHEGYQANISPLGSPRVDSEDVVSTRAQLRFTPTDAFEVTLRADYTDADQIPGGYMKTLTRTPAGLANDPLADSILGDYRKVALNTPEMQKSTNSGVAIDASYQLSENLTLTSLTGYRENDYRYTIDSDASAALVRRTDLGEQQDQLSEEINLRGRLGRLSFVTGAYYFKENIDAVLRVSNFIPGSQVNPNAVVATRAVAGYGQGTFELTSQWSITAGLRYTEEVKRFSQNYFIRSIPTLAALPTYPRVYTREGQYTAWTPKIAVDFRPTEEVLLYASVTRGFKSGGFNLTSASPTQGFAPELLWSYEAGVKAELFDHRLRLNASAFYYDYSALQVQAFITPGVADITNAADAKVKGVELEVLARPIPELELGGSLSHLDAAYVDYKSAPVGTSTVDASGNALNSSPKWGFSAFAQYTVNLSDTLSMFVRGEYSDRTRQFFTADNSLLQSQKRYSLINASVGLSMNEGKLQLIAFGRNLADTEYITTAASFTGPISGRVGAPRTYGLRLVVQY